MSEHQSIRETRLESTRPTQASPIQNEGLALLNRQQPQRPEQRQREPNSILEVPNMFPQQPARGSDIAGGACTTQAPRCESDRGWRPDYQRRTESGRNWDRQAEVQRTRPLETGPDDNYRVQRGDCLEDIARRMLRQEQSQNPSRRDVNDATRRILEANPQLRCNPDLIRPGMEIKIPRRTDSPPQPETRGEQPRPEGARPEAARPTPEAARPEGAKPEAARPTPEAARPEGARPATPESTKPEEARPDSSQIIRPETTKPEATKPEGSKPERTNPGQEPRVPQQPDTDSTHNDRRERDRRENDKTNKEKIENEKKGEDSCEQMDRNIDPSTNRDLHEELDAMKRCLESIRRQLEQLQRTNKKPYPGLVN